MVRYADCLRDQANFGLSDRGKLDEAAACYERALKIREAAHGASHRVVAVTLHGYAAFQLRALTICERQLGDDHPYTWAARRALRDLAKSRGVGTRYGDEDDDELTTKPVRRRAERAEKRLGRDHLEVSESLTDLAEVLRAQGKQDEARPLYERALAIQEKRLGPTHPGTVVAVKNLADLFLDQGDYAAAEPLLLRHVSVCENAFGHLHPRVAVALHALGELYKHQNKPDQAADLFRRSLDIFTQVPRSATSRALALEEVAHHAQSRLRGTQIFNPTSMSKGDWKRALGSTEALRSHEHLREEGTDESDDVARCLDARASLMQAQGDWAGALPLYERARGIRERRFGPWNHETALSLDRLATALQALRRLDEAEPLFRRALAIHERNPFGRDHPEIAASLTHLASLLRDLGRVDEAEPLLRRALQIKEKQLGPTHPGAVDNMKKLGAVLEERGGAFEEAERLQAAALRVSEDGGAPAGVLARGWRNLAGMSYRQGKYEDAEGLLRRAVAVHDEAEKRDRPSVGEAWRQLGALMLDRGDLAAAEVHFHRALAFHESQTGRDGPDVADACEALAGCFQRGRRHHEAEKMLRRVLAIREARLGKDHPELAALCTRLSQLLYEQGRDDDAEPMAARALKIAEAQLELRSTHFVDLDTSAKWRTLADALRDLGLILERERRFADARTYFQRAVSVYEAQLGADHGDLVGPLRHLAACAASLGDYGFCTPLARRILRLRERDLGDGHANVAVSCNFLAGRFDYAEALYRRAVGVFDARGPSDERNALNALKNLGELLLDAGKFADARPVWRRVAGLAERLDRTQVPAACRALGSVAHELGDLEDAEKHYRRELDLCEEACGTRDDVALAVPLNALAVLLQDAGRFDEAEPLYRESRRLNEKFLGEDHYDVAAVLDNYAELLVDMGRVDEAKHLFDRALAVYVVTLKDPDHPDILAVRDNLERIQGPAGTQRRPRQRRRAHARTRPLRGKRRKRQHRARGVGERAEPRRDEPGGRPQAGRPRRLRDAVAAAAARSPASRPGLAASASSPGFASFAASATSPAVDRKRDPASPEAPGRHRGVREPGLRGLQSGRREQPGCRDHRDQPGHRPQARPGEPLEAPRCHNGDLVSRGSSSLDQCPERIFTLNVLTHIV
ncbi:hypothetical protein JL722_14014 [Aureococcus anophagefferens]|nr:hypothetical protein JL722_14014 [Aureococcus anophagefferens]